MTEGVMMQRSWRTTGNPNGNRPLKPKREQNPDLFYNLWTKPARPEKGPNLRSTVGKLILDNPGMSYAEVARRAAEMLGRDVPSLQSIRFFATHMRMDLDDLVQLGLSGPEVAKWRVALEPYSRKRSREMRR